MNSESAVPAGSATGAVNALDVIADRISCIRCGHSLLGMKKADNCPECKTPISDSIERRTVENAFCIECGYQLKGLKPEGLCPECATPVERSLRGNLLLYSSLDYVQSLKRGAWLVITAIIIQVVVMILTFIGGFALLSTISKSSAGMRTFGIVSAGIGMLLSFMSWYGWWLLSEQDPAYRGQEQGTTARQVLRWSLALAAVQMALGFLFKLMPPGMAPAVVVFLFLLAGLGLILSAVTYFASMLYIRWLAPRLPNPKVYKRAKLLLWLGPVLMTLGILLVGLGPLIALVLYWNMLYWMYKDLKKIEGAISLENAAAAAVPA